MDLDGIIRRWRNAGIEITPKATDAAVSSFEQDNQVRLPDDMRDFYKSVGGMTYGSMDEDNLSIWPLTNIHSVPELLSGCDGYPCYQGIELSLPDSERYFVFGDFLILSHVFAIQLFPGLEKSGHVLKISSHQSWDEIAPTFGDFMKIYTEDPQRLSW